MMSDRGAQLRQIGKRARTNESGETSMVTEATSVSIDSLVSDYVARNPRSRELYDRALAVLPGGNTRTGLYMAPFPFYAASGSGKYLYDIDGHQLLDFVNNNTVLILGHAHP